MGSDYVEGLRTKLAGRTKRELIEGMITRSPHCRASNKTIAALEVYPLLLLLLARDFPTKLWILDRGEKPSSAEILNETARTRRWHRARITIDDCEGVTEFINNYVAVVVSWKTMLAIRHEFAHAVSTFFSASTRRRLDQLYREAKRRQAFTEPLARESLAEYAACGLSYCFFSDLRAELRAMDPELHDFMADLVRQAEEVSAMIATPLTSVL